MIDRLMAFFGYVPMRHGVAAELVGLSLEQVVELGVEAAKLGFTVDSMGDELRGYLLASGGFLDFEDVRALRDMKLRWMREEGL